MNIKIDLMFKFLAIICSILLIKNLFMLLSVQPVGYVINIYSMFPSDFYLVLMFCYSAAALLVLNGKRALGAYFLCANHFEILIIPYMLKYYSMGRADDMSYIGEYLQIATSGHFSGWDIYPDSLIIGAILSIVSNLNAHFISFIIPIVFSFILIAGICLFSRDLFPDYCIQSLVLVSSFILYLGVYNFLNVPHALFFALMPLYLFCFYRHMNMYCNISYSIIFVLMISIMPFSHPFIVFFLFVIFMFHLISMILPIKYIELLQIPRARIRSLLILVIPFIGWLFYNNYLSASFKMFYADYINKITEPVFVIAANQFQRINFSFVDYIQFLSFYYGRYIIPILIILISVFYLYSHKKLLKIKFICKYFYISVIFILLLCIQLVLAFNPIIAHQVDRIASLNFIIYAQVPLFAYSLYLLFLSQWPPISKMLLVCILLLLIWSLSLFGCFDSPNVHRPNVALTYNEVYGMNWFYDAKSSSSIVAVPMTQINRFHFLFGNFEIKDRVYMFPDHFGYVNSTNSNLAYINLALNKNSYIVILTIDKLLYLEINAYKSVGRYKKEDFDRFRNDVSVNKIYDSLNIGIYTA